MKAVMPLYTSPVEMVKVIREHVQARRHRVVPDDRPGAIGYRCLDCRDQSSVLPLTVSWHTEMSAMVSGRKRLTDFLNGDGDLATQAPTEVVRVPRYKRDPVI